MYNSVIQFLLQRKFNKLLLLASDSYVHFKHLRHQTVIVGGKADYCRCITKDKWVRSGAARVNKLNVTSK